jgi:hypothetical protein
MYISRRAAYFTTLLDESFHKRLRGCIYPYITGKLFHLTQGEATLASLSYSMKKKKSSEISIKKFKLHNARVSKYFTKESTRRCEKHERERERNTRERDRERERERETREREKHERETERERERQRERETEREHD